MQLHFRVATPSLKVTDGHLSRSESHVGLGVRVELPTDAHTTRHASSPRRARKRSRLRQRPLREPQRLLGHARHGRAVQLRRPVRERVGERRERVGRRGRRRVQQQRRRRLRGRER
jgi:hypothetical protein